MVASTAESPPQARQVGSARGEHPPDSRSRNTSLRRDNCGGCAGADDGVYLRAGYPQGGCQIVPQGRGLHGPERLAGVELNCLAALGMDHGTPWLGRLYKGEGVQRAKIRGAMLVRRQDGQAANVRCKTANVLRIGDGSVERRKVQSSCRTDDPDLVVSVVKGDQQRGHQAPHRSSPGWRRWASSCDVNRESHQSVVQVSCRLHETLHGSPRASVHTVRRQSSRSRRAAP